MQHRGKAQTPFISAELRCGYLYLHVLVVRIRPVSLPGTSKRVQMHRGGSRNTCAAGAQNNFGGKQANPLQSTPQDGGARQIKWRRPFLDLCGYGASPVVFCEGVALVCRQRSGRSLPLEKLADSRVEKGAVCLPHGAQTQRMNPPCRLQVSRARVLYRALSRTAGRRDSSRRVGPIDTTEFWMCVLDNDPPRASMCAACTRTREIMFMTSTLRRSA